MPIWNRKYESMPRSDLEQLQLERLQTTVNRAYRNVRFYHRTFEESGIVPEDIQSLEDLCRLPFTTKDDLREAYPYDLFSVPLHDIVRIHASSGTTGRSTVVGYTRHDLRVWSECVARVISAAGVTKQDVVQITFGYGLFTGGFGLHYGAEKVGASVIPVSAGNTERQIQIMRDFKTTAIVGTSSYALHIAEVLEEMGIDPTSLSLKVGLFGAEPCSERTRAEIESRLHILATDNYGLSEVMGPGVSGECECQKGLHVNEDHFLVELVDPETLEPVPLGQEGELVITTLTKQGMPLLRYRTRDLTTLHLDPCECGRTNIRMSKVRSRTDDMLIVRGVNLFPSQIEAILFEIEHVEPHYHIILDRHGALDELTIQVEVSREIFADQMRLLVGLENKIKARVHSVLGLTPNVKLVEPKTLERSQGKAKRVIDNRSME